MRKALIGWRSISKRVRTFFALGTALLFLVVQTALSPLTTTAQTGPTTSTPAAACQQVLPLEPVMHF
jgi:hypothetical protein